MTLEDVMAISHLAGRIRAFSRLPKKAQDRVFTADELAASDARDELYDRYMRQQIQASSFINELVEQDESAKLLVQWLLRFLAAQELRCETAGIPPPVRSPLPMLISRETIDKFKAALRRETCQA